MIEKVPVIECESMSTFLFLVHQARFAGEAVALALDT